MDGSKIKVVYDGDGQVWRKMLTSTTDTLPNGLYTMRIDYIDGFEYHDGAFASYMHPQGRVAPGDNGFNCEYFLRDHLGSVRVVYADVDGDRAIDFDTVECELLEEHHYYPFGMEMEGMWTDFRTGQFINRNTYNGKQAQTEMGWDWINYGARYYDPMVGRWNSVDPWADAAPDWTPYRYGFNNPISFIDLDGLFESKADAKDYKREHGIKGNIKEQEDGTFAITKGGHITHYFGSGSVNPAIVQADQVPEYGTFMGISGRLNAPQSAGGAFADMVQNVIYTSAFFYSAGEIGSSLFSAGRTVASLGAANAAKTVPNLTEQAATLSQRFGKNSITLGTPTKQIRFDLVGKAHGNVPTPHMQIYNKNFVNGVQKSISRASKEAVPMTQQEIRMIRKYIEKLGN